MKIAIYGDSISEGIGKRKINYSNYLKEIMEKKGEKTEIANYAHTGTTIKYLTELLNNSVMDYSVSIIGYGNVDAMLRPDLKHTPNYYKYLPNRYKQNGMLNPRPYYSKRWYKKWLQKCDSCFRTGLNKILLKLQGKTTWISMDEFRDEYVKCIRKIKKSGCEKIVLLSTVHVSDKYFPGTNVEYQKINLIINKIAMKEKCIFIDLYSLLDESKYFYDDLFHPNNIGYEKIAEAIGQKLL